MNVVTVNMNNAITSGAADFQACARCGAMYSVAGLSPSKRRRRVYCSVDCNAQSKRTLPKNTPRPCVVCGAEFKPSRKRGDAKYCSKSCIWQATRGPEFNARIARATAEKRADAQRGRGKADGYIKRGGRHEHRVVAEQALGRKLLPGEIVHHLDNNKRNNARENLQVMTQSEHARGHKPRLGTGKAKK